MPSSSDPVSGLRADMGAIVLSARCTNPTRLIGISGMVMGGIVKGPRATEALVILKCNAGIGMGATCRGPTLPIA
ncbi:hypothetical protein MSIMFI_05593 [Mycobacterium simulans]|nr:hypothetical protein MSIMFI_05593 [Mycobacterium simulans]